MCNIKIKFSIKEILHKINQKLDNLSDNITDINLRLNKIEIRLNSGFPASKEDIQKIEGSQKAQIWTLIGGLITAVVGFLAAVGRFIFYSS